MCINASNQESVAGESHPLLVADEGQAAVGVAGGRPNLEVVTSELDLEVNEFWGIWGRVLCVEV